MDALCAKFRISGVPVTDAGGQLVGIITNRDMRFEVDHSKPVSEVMSPAPLITARVGVSLRRRRSACCAGTSWRSCRSSTATASCAG